MAIRGPVFTDRARAESFGAVAADYDRYRPSYPAQLVQDLVRTGARTVLDVGCGTGKAGALLAARGLDVLGVEIDEQMAAVARAHGLAVEVAAFEEWDDAGRQFDLLTCGQAWHWVEPQRGADKAAQVVRPGGTVALFWNYDDPGEANRNALEDVYREFAPELVDGGPRRPLDDGELVASFERRSAFSAVEKRGYRWQRSFSADEWVGMVFTHSDHLLLPADRRIALAEAVRALVVERGGITADYGTYLLLAHRAA